MNFQQLQGLGMPQHKFYSQHSPTLRAEVSVPQVSAFHVVLMFGVWLVFSHFGRTSFTLTTSLWCLFADSFPFDDALFWFILSFCCLDLSWSFQIVSKSLPVGAPSMRTCSCRKRLSVSETFRQGQYGLCDWHKGRLKTQNGCPVSNKYIYI